MPETLSLTPTKVGKLKTREREYTVKDTSQDSPRGFSVRVYPSGVKTFQLHRWFRGKTKRVALGKHPETSLATARKKAWTAVDTLSLDIRPEDAERAKTGREVTVKTVFKSYIAERTGRVKQSTLDEYENVASRHLKPLYDIRLFDVTREVVLKRHREITQEGKETTANKALRLLSILFNFAREEYLDEYGRSLFPDNPVGVLKARRRWNTDKRRRTTIRRAGLKAFWDASESENHPVFRDVIRTILLTGFRVSNAVSITGANLDSDEKTLNFNREDMKGGRVFVLPLGDRLFKLLDDRKRLHGNGPLFPSPLRMHQDEHVFNIQKPLRRVAEKTGIKVTAHDLRRTFISIAETLDISAGLLSALLDHARDSETESYISREVTRLRDPMQRIEDEIFRLVE